MVLGGVFILFIFAIIRLVRLVQAVFTVGDVPPSSSEILHRLQVEDFSTLGFLLVAFGSLWLYSVIDAFLRGQRADRMEADREGDEGVSDR